MGLSKLLFLERSYSFEKKELSRIPAQSARSWGRVPRGAQTPRTFHYQILLQYRRAIPFIVVFWYGIYHKTKDCRNPGSNQGHLDLQSNALPTELFRLEILVK